MFKFLRRCSWSAWIVYHDWKFQIRKEIKETKSEREKSDLSTDQYLDISLSSKIQLTQGQMD